MTDQRDGSGWSDQRPVTIDYQGDRNLLGRTADAYAIWRTEGGPAIRTFPLTNEGWTEAWRVYRELEAQTGFVPTSEWKRGQPIPMRQMRAGQVLGGAFRLYRMHFWTLILAVVFILVPFTALALGLQLGTGRPVVQPLPQGTVTIFEPAPWVTWVINLLRFMVVTPFLTAVVVGLASNAYRGERVTVDRTYRRAVPKIHSILWVSVLTGLAVFGVMLPALFLVAGAAFTGNEALLPSAVLLAFLLLVPAIFLVLRFLYGPAAVVVEDRKGTDALRRSWNLVKGLTWKVLGAMVLAILVLLAFYLVVGIIVGVVYFAAVGPGVFEMGTRGIEIGPSFVVGSTLLGMVAEILTLPFVTLVIVLLYFDARIRKEGLDLGGGAHQIEGSPPAEV